MKIDLRYYYKPFYKNKFLTKYESILKLDLVPFSSLWSIDYYLISINYTSKLKTNNRLRDKNAISSSDFK